MENQELDPQKINQEISQTDPVEDTVATQPIQVGGDTPEEKMRKEQAIVDDLIPRFIDWDSSRKTRENLWQRIYRLFFSTQEQHKTSTRSNITIPIIFQIIESAVPKIANVLFAQGEDFFDVAPEDQNDENATLQAVSIKRLLSVQLSKAKFFVKFLDFIKQMMLYGTSYLKVYWKVKREWVWERVPNRTVKTILGIPMGETIEWQETKSYKVVERRPEIEVLDILDVFPDPDAQDDETSKGLFVRSWIPRDDLRELGQGKFPIYANTERPELQSSEDSYVNSRSDRYTARGLHAANTTKKNQVELLEFWGKYDLDGDGIKEEAHIVIANRQVLVKAQANPFYHQRRPIIRGVLFPAPKEWYGIGLVEPVISEVHELNTLRRQRIDNINLVLNRMWQANTLADVDLETLISSPGNIVLTDAMDAVKPLDTPDVTTSAYNEANIVQMDIERATVPPSAQGNTTSGQLGRTARGAQLIIGQALEKFGTATKLLEEMTLKELLDMIHQLNLQFIDDDEVLQDPYLYGEIAQLGMTPEDIRANVKFKMIGISEMVGSEGKINQIVSFMGVFGKVLSPDSITSLSKKVWKLMGFNENEITLAGAQLVPGVENVVDPTVSAAIVGQAGNQGTQGQPSVPPTMGK
jgi:hypothetical protein